MVPSPYLVGKVYDGTDAAAKERGHHPLVLVTRCEMALYQ